MIGVALPDYMRTCTKANVSQPAKQPRYGMPARHLGDRKFTGYGQNQLRVACLTCVPIPSGFIYPAMAGDGRAVTAT